jgi:hypothetical protein
VRCAYQAAGRAGSPPSWRDAWPLPLLWFVRGIARDRGLMGEAVLGRAGSAASIVVISISVTMLLALSL